MKIERFFKRQAGVVVDISTANVNFLVSPRT